ncbi:hypothetical protein F2Q70_00029239 [Brassica cretica]|uniref:Uncharacterized protein n=1 Tax=Brassica cretica TaxID=69181 RepID=A0A8S9FJS6_BRACR|nr:hypothetical protein F2Q70_00029239 [Brassica cretica]
MCSNKRGSWAIYRKQQPIRNKPCGSLCVALHGSGHMRGGTSSSTCPSAWPAHMQGDTMPSTCLDAWPGSMQGDITSSTCLAAWPGRMHRDTSCLAVPPRASMCHSACCDHLYYNTSCFPFHTHTARSLPPRPEHAHQATSSFLVNSADFAFPSFYRRRLSGSSRRFLLRHVRVDDSFRVDGISSVGLSPLANDLFNLEITRGPSSKKQGQSLLSGAIETASLSASRTSPQDGTGDEKGSVKGRHGLVRPPTSEDGNKCRGPSSTRPMSDIGETDPPPGSEYGSDLNGTRDRRTTGAMSCLREAC